MTKTTIAAGRHLSLVQQDGWEYVERNGVTGVVVILPVTDAQTVILTEQFRRPVGRRVIDLPAGLAGDEPGTADEELCEAARRELLEETGYQAHSWRRLATGPSSAGLTSEVVTFFLAGGLAKVGSGGGDASEEIEVHEVPLDELSAWLRKKSDAGVFIDPKIYAALFLAER